MFYLMLLFLAICVVFFFFFFIARIKKNSIKLTLFYVAFYICFSFYFNLIYIENFLLWCAGYFEESFIIKDPNDWVWALFIFSFFFLFLFFLPYYFLLIHLKFMLYLYREEQILLQIFTTISFYCVYLSLYLVLKDFAFAGIISLSESKNVLFEFQLELEHIVLFIFGTYVDFLFSLIFFNIYIIFINKYFFVLKKKYFNNKMNQIFAFFWLLIIYYWFGGEGWQHDSILLFFSFLLLETVQIFSNFLYLLSRSKNILAT